jgi:hypothetical protein
LHGHHSTGRSDACSPNVTAFAEGHLRGPPRDAQRRPRARGRSGRLRPSQRGSWAHGHTPHRRHRLPRLCASSRHLGRRPRPLERLSRHDQARRVPHPLHGAVTVKRPLRRHARGLERVRYGPRSLARIASMYADTSGAPPRPEPAASSTRRPGALRCAVSASRVTSAMVVPRSAASRRRRVSRSAGRESVMRRTVRQHTTPRVETRRQLDQPLRATGPSGLRAPS